MTTLIIFTLFSGLFIGFLIGRVYGYEQGERDEAKRPYRKITFENAELIGYLEHSITSTQTTGIHIMPLKDRSGVSYLRGTGVYLNAHKPLLPTV